ncbi:MAG TPA: amino acid permease [Candidatus Limnocylindrales bacterium]|jgi:amino acid transporter|nr:amino acid permease [Candidatus Limnocylindrales bacterium]
MARSREDVIRQDVADLHQLGYAQELFRSMGGFSNFAISFSIISILTGAVILYDYGLAWAGTAAVLIGWPLITIFVLAIAASMAEIASAYPTAGGLYYWASRMKNKEWGWWTAWLNLIGQFAIVAGINYAAAGFLNATIITPLLGNIGMDYGNTSVFIGGLLNGQLVTMGILMAIQLAMNIGGINLVSLLNQVSVWWHIVIVAAVVFLVFLAGKPDQSGLTLFAVQPLDTAGSWDNNLGFVHLTYGPATTYPLFFAFFFSLLQANWTYTGYDASAHVAEETVGARVASAWGLFLSVAVSAVVGFLFLLALTTHLPDLSTLFPADLSTADPATYSQYYFGGGAAVIDILAYNLGQLGNLLSAGIAIAMAFCGLSSVASAGRMLYAFSRDDGLPGSAWLKKVSHRYRTPANSLVAMVVISWLFSVGAFIVGTGTAIVIITAISTIFLYAAYGVVIYLGATTDGWLRERVWSLGRWSKPIAWVAVLWCIVLMFLFSWPTSGNISWPFMIGTVVLLLIYYFGWARTRFKGPRAMGDSAELTEIEREFSHAAEELEGPATA